MPALAPDRFPSWRHSAYYGAGRCARVPPTPGPSDRPPGARGGRPAIARADHRGV